MRRHCNWIWMSFEIPSIYTADFSLHVIQSQSLSPVTNDFEKKPAMWKGRYFSFISLLKEEVLQKAQEISAWPHSDGISFCRQSQRSHFLSKSSSALHSFPICQSLFLSEQTDLKSCFSIPAVTETQGWDRASAHDCWTFVTAAFFSPREGQNQKCDVSTRDRSPNYWQRGSCLFFATSAKSWIVSVMNCVSLSICRFIALFYEATSLEHSLKSHIY